METVPVPAVLLERCSPLAVWVYLHLSRRAGEQGALEASSAQVSGWCGASWTVVLRSLRELEAVGVCWIERRVDERGAQLPNRYCFPVPEAPQPPPPAEQKPSVVDRSAPPIPASLDTPEFRAELERYLEVRKEKRWGRWLRKTWESNIRKWEKWGVERATAALKQSADNQYQGVFEPKGTNGGPKLKTMEERRAELERSFPGWKSDSWYREHGFEPPSREE